MERIYIVMAICAEPDADFWVVAGYPEEEQAKQHCKLANAWVSDQKRRKRKKPDDDNPYDANYRVPYHYPFYQVHCVAIVRHVDEYMESIDSGE